MADTLKDIPEFFETELGESIAARTDALGLKRVEKFQKRCTFIFI